MTPTETAAILRQFNNWCRDPSDFPASPMLIEKAIDAAIAMIDRLEGAESDALEQARLNGMGASREAALLAKLEAAEKERDKLKELNSALYTNSNSQVIHNARLAEENYALRAKVEAMEKQEPAMWANSSNIISAKINKERRGVGDQHTCSETKTAYHDTPLYLGAQGE